MSTEKSKGMAICSLSEHVTRLGQFKVSMGITLRQLLELSGGIRANHELKSFTPGGSSAPILTPEHLDIPLNYEGMASASTMLGTKALQVSDEITSVMHTTLRWVEFYKRESCGKYIPYREGSRWLAQLLMKFEAGTARGGGVDKLLDVCTGIDGRSFYVLTGGTVVCVISAVYRFCSELGQNCHTFAWKLLPYERSALFAMKGGLQ